MKPVAPALPETILDETVIDEIDDLRPVIAWPVYTPLVRPVVYLAEPQRVEPAPYREGGLMNRNELIWQNLRRRPDSVYVLAWGAEEHVGLTVLQGFRAGDALRIPPGWLRFAGGMT